MRASRISAGSTPALAPRTSASAMPASVAAMTIWLHAFVTWPAPRSPTWTMVVPMTWSSGRQASRTSLRPPAMMDSVPASAPGGPPLTGASRHSTPPAAAAAPRRRVTSGDIVDMSIQVVPGAAPASRPCSPATTASTSGLSVTIVMTMSERSAASAGVAACSAPSATSGAAFAAVRLWTVSRKPALSTLRAIGRPMSPSPTNPTRVLPGSAATIRRPPAFKVGAEGNAAAGPCEQGLAMSPAGPSARRCGDPVRCHEQLVLSDRRLRAEPAALQQRLRDHAPNGREHLRPRVALHDRAPVADRAPAEDPVHDGGDLLAVRVPGEQLDAAVGHLPEDRDVAADERHPGHRGLQQRQPEPLALAGDHHHVADAVQLGDVGQADRMAAALAGQLVEEADDMVQAQAGAELEQLVGVAATREVVRVDRARDHDP